MQFVGFFILTVGNRR